MRRVYRFHKANPEVLDFLVSGMRVDRENGWTRTSLGSLWHYARWVLTRKQRVPGESFVMSNNYFPHYERIIAILHPDLNGFFEMAKSKADADLGIVLEPARRIKAGTAAACCGRTANRLKPDGGPQHHMSLSLWDAVTGLSEQHN